MKIKVPKLPIVYLDMNLDINKPGNKFVHPNLKPENVYAVIGEADLKHYILFDITEGVMLKGIYEMDRFKLDKKHERL